MAKLIYSSITSLDGCVADEDGNFDLAVPDEEVHTFVNDLERPVMQDFAEIWQAADKIVYSKTLEAVSATAWFTFTTAPGREETSTLPGRQASRTPRDSSTAAATSSPAPGATTAGP